MSPEPILVKRQCPGGCGMRVETLVDFDRILNMDDAYLEDKVIPAVNRLCVSCASDAS